MVARIKNFTVTFAKKVEVNFMAKENIKSNKRGKTRQLHITPKRKEQYLKQTQILCSEFSELLGLYFACEKVARDMTNIVDITKPLDLSCLKKVLKGKGIVMCDHDLDLIFNTSWKKKNPNQYSFRNIRNNVCHRCSIADRNHAIQYKKEYLSAMTRFFDICYG